jgi:hypothetical protein
MATGWPMKTTYANGDVYSASDVNDTNGTINLLGASVAYAAGKNRILNSDFRIWQRGTSFTAAGYTADRWTIALGGGSGANTTSQQSFTAGTAPVAGYEGQYFLRWNQTTGASGNPTLIQKIEDVRSFAGQTVTVSFWAKVASAGTPLASVVLAQEFGSGGSSTVNATLVNSPSLTTSWTRYTYSVSVPSISGKTIGTGSSLSLVFYGNASTTYTFDVWGVQVEQGSTATAFQTATGNIASELAVCQRYYERRTVGGANFSLGINGLSMTTNAGSAQVMFASPKRTNPSVSYGGNLVFVNNAWNQAVTALNGIYGAGTSGVGFVGGAMDISVASGLTAGQPAWLRDNGAGTAFIEFSSEL